MTEKETVAKNATVQHEGGKLVTRNIDYYNLDVIISVGYRMKSQNGIVFRRWANSVLKEYLLKGYMINEKRTLVTNRNYVNLIHKVEGVLEKKVDELDNRVTRKSYIYSNEADLLNVTLFGKTAKEWRETNTGKEGNIRDYANTIELAMLSNLEYLNSMLISQKLSQKDRLVLLNKEANREKELFNKNNVKSIKRIEKK